jgi:hypothetical protein
MTLLFWYKNNNFWWRNQFGEVASIRNHYNELAVTLNQKKPTDKLIRFVCLTMALVSLWISFTKKLIL